MVSFIAVLRIMQAFTEVSLIVVLPYLKSSTCCLLRSHATPSVALLAFIIPLFSFQGADSGLRPEQNTQKFLLEYFGPFSGAGGDKRDRTADLLRAKQALSHLSYTPMLKVVGLSGLEPPTLRLSVVRSSQLS